MLKGRSLKMFFPFKILIVEILGEKITYTKCEFYYEEFKKYLKLNDIEAYKISFQFK